MAEFTRTDRALLIRVGGHLHSSAVAIENAHQLNWGEDETARTAKKLRDRLRRDEIDLAALRKRLEAKDAPVAPAGALP